MSTGPEYDPDPRYERSVPAERASVAPDEPATEVSPPVADRPVVEERRVVEERSVADRPVVEERTVADRPVVQDRPVVADRPVTARPVARTRPDWTGLVLRIVLTLLGAAGLIVGAFMEWVRSAMGTEIGVRALWAPRFGHAEFARSAGLVMIVLGLVALVGLAPRTGWLTRLAGALGIVGFVLLAIELYRAPGGLSLSTIRPGLWVCLVGAVVALIGGFFGTRHRVVLAESDLA